MGFWEEEEESDISVRYIFKMNGKGDSVERIAVAKFNECNHF